jgi:hypothetical protein
MMPSRNLTYSGLFGILVLTQPLALLLYLNANIANVGEAGVALPVLAAYMVLSAVMFAMLWFHKNLLIGIHSFVFLTFVLWIAVRVIIDLGELEQLKAITVATTGGILLFYLIGALFSVSYFHILKYPQYTIVCSLVVLFFGGLMLFLLSSLLPRLREDIFYIAGANSAHQRPGNLLSISFIMVSAILLALSCRQAGCKSEALKFFFWIAVYSASAVTALISAQLIGSNSATAVVGGIFILTFMFLLLMRSRRLRQYYADGKLALPLSKHVLTAAVGFALFGLVALFLLIAALVWSTGSDITSTRLLGFGAGTNTSVSTRIEILVETGVDQLSYAPLLGNMNVTFLTTGSEAATLHSFFLFIIANLGVVGLILALVLFILVFRQLLRTAKNEADAKNSLEHALINLYCICVLLFLLVFANLTVGVSWAVLWFTLGFISQPFRFESRMNAASE